MLLSRRVAKQALVLHICRNGQLSLHTTWGLHPAHSASLLLSLSSFFSPPCSPSPPSLLPFTLCWRWNPGPCVCQVRASAPTLGCTPALVTLESTILRNRSKLHENESRILSTRRWELGKKQALLSSNVNIDGQSPKPRAATPMSG